MHTIDHYSLRKVVTGTPTRKLIENLPQGCRVKVRLRPYSAGRAFVRYDDATEEWILEDGGDAWKLGWLIGVNYFGGDDK